MRLPHDLMRTLSDQKTPRNAAHAQNGQLRQMGWRFCIMSGIACPVILLLSCSIRSCPPPARPDGSKDCRVSRSILVPFQRPHPACLDGEKDSTARISFTIRTRRMGSSEDRSDRRTNSLIFASIRASRRGSDTSRKKRKQAPIRRKKGISPIFS